jgi:hypothetical protein
MKKIAIVLMSASCLSSCAVMFQGSKKDVTIKSLTPNATINVDGEEVGKDAVTIRLERKSNHTIIVRKDECESKTVEVKKKTQVGWVIFDALFNWFAFATDAPTGAWNTFEKDHYTVELQCKKTPTSTN